MGEVENEDRRVMDGFLERRIGDEVGGKGNIGQVFDVVVEVIDQLGQLVRLSGELGSGVVVF